MRIELTFKSTEKVLYEFVKENSKYVSTSGYIKSLIAKEMQNK